MKKAYLLILGCLFALSVLQPFLANDKPIVCRLSNRNAIQWPAWQGVMQTVGWSNMDSLSQQQTWKEQTYEWAVWPPIRYATNTMDRRNMNYKSPLGAQQIASWKERHWLGTDKLGRDVAAGMLNGLRIALWVALGAVFLSGIVGVFVGAVAGYFGNYHLRATPLAVGLASVPVLYLIILCWMHPFIGVLGWFGVGLLGVGCSVLLWKAGMKWGKKQRAIPLDRSIMRCIELFNSIPGLLLLIAISAVVQRPSVWLVIGLIALVQWPLTARYTRAEIMRVRSQDYVEAARVMGLSHGQTIFRHILPNSLGPVVITLVFQAVAAILIEASLSFLGLGMPPDVVTWGNMLSGVRTVPKAWWLAVFPGIGVFGLIVLFNAIGKSLQKAKL